MRLILFLFLLRFGFARNCSEDEFSCTLGEQCIPLVKWQDGIEDCVDASDEVCLPWQFDCKFGNPRCINSKKVNDKKIDCYSALDEGCPSHFFVCSDRSKCIDPSKYQNGVIDCLDGSDEPCKPGDFPCNNGGCIPGKQFQDGQNNCVDGSDEECTSNQFECVCGKKRCIPVGKVNDGKRDCEDGSDEEKGPPPSSCPNGSSPRNGRTSLPIGSNVTICSEPNPCPTELGQICIIVGGAWRCVCKLGLVRPVGSTRCLPSELLPQYLANPASNCTDYQKDVQLQIGKLKVNSQQLIHAISMTRSPFPSTHFPSSERVFKDERHQATHMVTPHKRSSTIVSSSVTVTPQIISGTTKRENGDEYGNTMRVGNSGYEQNHSGSVEIVNSDDNSTSEPFDFLLDEENEELYEMLKDEGNCDPNDKNPCKDPHTSCILNLQGFYYCGCGGNTTSVDGECIELMDECANGSADCDPSAICMDNDRGFECLCREGYLDVSPTPTIKPGRKCHKLINECSNGSLNDCHPNSKCIDKPSGFTCRCHPEYYDVSPNGARNPGRECVKLIDECSTHSHDCHSTAICKDIPNGFICSCPNGSMDVSIDKNKPGRICALMSTDESPQQFPSCVRSGNSTKCTCPTGYKDADPRRPGERCLKEQSQQGNHIGRVYF